MLSKSSFNACENKVRLFVYPCRSTIQVHCLPRYVTAKRNWDLGSFGTLKNTEHKLMNKFKVEILEILDRTAIGFGTTWYVGMRQSFRALESSTKRHVDFLSLRTRKIGVLH